MSAQGCQSPDPTPQEMARKCWYAAKVLRRWGRIASEHTWPNGCTDRQMAVRMARLAQAYQQWVNESGASK